MSVTKPKLFKSYFTEIGTFASAWPDETVKNEPMFYNSSIQYAYREGGPITKAFINAMPQEWHEGVFDSRVHMLMPGWFPCIPGYHHDDVPRAGKSKQPNYENPKYLARHLMGLVNAEVCPTVFAVGTCWMPSVSGDEIVYKVWHKEVERLVHSKQLEEIEIESGKLVEFDSFAFHAGQRAKLNGWRWFGRVTLDSDRCESMTDEIRRQVQVYLEFPIEGW